jgi:hypothetical protein
MASQQSTLQKAQKMKWGELKLIGLQWAQIKWSKFKINKKVKR